MSTLDDREGRRAGRPGGADAPTDAFPRPHGSPSHPRPPLLVGVVALAAVLALGLVVDAVLGWPGADEGLQGTERAGPILHTGWCWSLAGAYVWLGWAMWARRAATRRLAAVLAAVVVTLALFSSAAGIGALVATGAGLLALVLAVDRELGGALVRPANPIASARLLVGWWLGATVYAAVLALTRAGYKSIEPLDAASSTAAGVLFWCLAAVGVVVLVATAARHGGVRWVFAGTWVVDAVAVGMIDSGNHAFWALLVLHAAAALALLLPARARTYFGDAPLAWTRTVATWWAGVLAAPRAVVLGVGGGVVALLGLIVALAGAATPGSPGTSPSVTSVPSSSDDLAPGSSWSVVAAVVIALLCVVLTLTPTMPTWWRGGLGAVGALLLVLAFGGDDLFEGRLGAVTLLVPVVAVASSGLGAWTNWRTGATSTRPGWEGVGAPPPSASPRFPWPPTAGGRSRVQLRADSALGGDALLDAAVRMCAVRGNWFLVGTDTVGAGPRQGDRVVLGLHSGRTRCGEFRARTQRGGPRTTLVVGGMDRWTRRREYWFRVVPAGPASMQGFFMYRLYLQTVASELVRLDPTARITLETSREHA